MNENTAKQVTSDKWLVVAAAMVEFVGGVSTLEIDGGYTMVVIDGYGLIVEVDGNSW